MKKLFSILLISVLLIGFTGCINNKNENNSGYTGSDSTNDLGLYSDDTKYVFLNDNSIHVFYYEDDKITAYHVYVNYEEEELAKFAYDAVTPDTLETVEKYYVRGKYLVFEYKESEYMDLELSQLDKTFAYMKKIEKEDLES